MKCTNLISLSSMLLAFAGSFAVGAATLTNIPMQGTMVMPKLSYDAELSRVTVEMTAVVPQLTPLLVSNPSDWFDPTDPWFSTLDPSATGMSFSRRYGFVMKANTDLLPANTQIWIRKLSGSPDLFVYRHQAAEPKAFQPIFGTSGTTNAMYWNGLMFHPTFATPPGTNSLSATFEAYLLNTVTGEETPGSSSGPFDLQWTDVSDGRPALSIGPGMVISWPDSTGTNWQLEAAPALGGTWTAVTETPVSSENRKAVIIDPVADGRRLFRMRWAQ